MSAGSSAPRQVLVAGALVCLQALAALAVAAVLLTIGLSAPADARLVFGAFGAFVVIAAAIAVPGIALVRGRRGGRNAAVFIQLLLLGAIWYQFSTAEWVSLDVAVTAWCVAVLVLLFVPGSRVWAAPSDPAASEH